MSETIREFLVKIGYQEQGKKEFESSLHSVTRQAIELGVAIKGAAVAVQAAVTVIAGHLENLYFLAQRSNATAESIRAIGFAATQVGGSVESARGSIENLGRFLRINPGAENFIASLGVQTRDANGQLRETGALMADVVRSLKGRQPGVALATANVLGIDERTLLGAGSEFDQQQARYDRMQRAAHFNVTQASKDSHFFMSELRTLGGAIGILQDKVASAFTRSMGEEISRFTVWLVNNFDKISATVEFVANKILDAGRIVMDFGRYLWTMVVRAKEAWDQLDADSKVGLAALAAIAGAIWAVNLAVGASPLVRLALLALGFAALLNEYQAWQDGAQSVIPWEKWDPDIKQAILGMRRLGDEFKTVGTELKKLFGTIEDYSKRLRSLLGGDNDASTFTERFMGNMKHLVHYLGQVIELIDAVLNWDRPRALAVLQAMKDDAPGFGGGGGRSVAGSDNRRDRDSYEPRKDPADETHGSRGLWYELFQADAPGSNPAMRFASRLGNVLSGQRGSGDGSLTGRPSSAEEAKLQQRAYSLLTEKYGYSHDEAVGLIANFHEESNLDTQARGPGGAVGIAQWSPERRAKFREIMGIDVLDATFEQQIAFIHWELSNTHRAVRQRMAQARGSRAVSDVVLEGYEAPSAENQARRRGGATAALIDPNFARPNAEVPQVPRQTQPLRLLPPSIPPLGVGPQSSNDDYSRSVAMNQTNHITVQTSGASDGWAIGRSVMEAQRSVAAQTVRDMAARVA